MVISKVFRLLTNVRNTFILVNSPNKLVTQKNYFHLHKKPSAGKEAKATRILLSLIHFLHFNFSFFLRGYSNTGTEENGHK